VNLTASGASPEAFELLYAGRAEPPSHCTLTSMARPTAASAPPRGVERTIRARLLVDADHYDHLIARRVAEAKVSVWIATANLKTMLVEAPIGSRARARGRYVSFFETLGELARAGVDVRVLHAGAPSGPLAREVARLGLGERVDVKMRRCPRVHLKVIAIDGRLLYLGSANLTGAGLGAKGEGRRNFEMGITTDSEAMLDVAQERFDRIWRGAECASCKLRGECERPLDTLDGATSRGGSRRTRRSPSPRP
jgi:phosphatidylserine/phosphatidylglycerophosphate/cardiolipin synthase-like enzyme